MRLLAPVTIAIVLTTPRLVAAQPTVAAAFSDERVRVTVWGGLRDRVTIGRLVSHDTYSVNVLTCSSCDTTRIPWSLLDRFEVHMGGNATAFNVSKGAIGVGAIAGAIVAGVSARRSGCRGDVMIVCPAIVDFSAALGLLAGTLPGIAAAILTHERWRDVPLKPRPSP